MKMLKTIQLDKHSCVTTFDNEFILDLNTALLYYETTGLNANQDKITLLGVAHNKNGYGQILQIYDWDGNNENLILEKMINYLCKFESVIISWPWFSEFLDTRLSNYNISSNIHYNLNCVYMRTTYRNFKPGFDINYEARESIDKYYNIKKFRNEIDIYNYLAYNRDHFLAYDNWLNEN